MVPTQSLYETGRPVVNGTQGVVTAGHYLTSMAGMRMLLTGGNAFDAAVAAGFAAAVVEPTASYSLASEGSFLLYHAASRQVRVLSSQGVAAGLATVELFKGKGLDKVPTGPGPNAELSFTVPGVADALMLLLETYGIKTLGEVLAPALPLCPTRVLDVRAHAPQAAFPGPVGPVQAVPAGWDGGVLSQRAARGYGGAPDAGQSGSYIGEAGAGGAERPGPP